MSTHMDNMSSSTTTTASYKSSTTSVSSHPDSFDQLTQQAPFTSLIANEKHQNKHDEFGLHERLLIPDEETRTDYDTRGESDDDDVECEEINRITVDYTTIKSNDEGVRDDASPEPIGNDELGALRDELLDGGASVEFQEFVIDGEMLYDNMSVSSKTIKSYKSSSIQQSSVDESSSANQLVIQESSANDEASKKCAKVERKSSKAGKKSKSNAEISKENISVCENNIDTNKSTPIIPEDLAKKLGPGESRVFAKVCVANLRRSFGDLTVINEPTSDNCGSSNNNNAQEYHGFVKRSNPIQITNRCMPSTGGGPSSLPTYSSCALRSNCSSSNNSSNKLQLFQPSYWEGMFCSSSSLNQKSSFSKFDNLAKSNEKPPKIQPVEQKDQDQTKPEPKKMFCTSCDKQVFQMELIRAEKKDWHKNCFRCVTCRKVLSMDTYQSHEHRLYCKPHFKELFQPKAVLDDTQQEEEIGRTSKQGRSKLQLIICESQPKELPPDVVRASDTPATGLEDISIDVRSKFELFENFKDQADSKSLEPLPVKRSASVLAKLKKYENSLASGSNELNGVSDEDLHGVDAIELQSDEDDEEELDEENSVIRSEIKRKLKNPLQALNEIAHFKQMEQVRSKWEEGGVGSRDQATDQRKEELQKFRSRLCHGKSNQLKEMYEKALEGETAAGGTSSRAAEMEELKSEKAKTFRDMFEKGEVRKVIDDDDTDAVDGEKFRNGVDLEVFEAGVAKESRSMFEKLDRRVNDEMKDSSVCKKREVRTNTFVKKNAQPICAQSFEVVRCMDRVDEPVKVDTQELTSKFKFFETFEDEMAKKAKETRRDTLKRITPPREDGVVKTEKDYDDDESTEVYRDPEVVRHGESSQDDSLQKSKTASKMLNIFRQMEENLSKGEGKDPIIRPMKQFTPPRDTAPRVFNDNSEDEEEEDEEDVNDEEEEDQEDEEEDKHVTEDEFLKEVGSLARARSLRAKFERWEQQENERNKQSAAVQEELSESIESARNLKAKFEAMRLVGDNKENSNGASPVPLRVNRFVLNTNNSRSRDFDYCAYNSSSSSSSTSLPATINNQPESSASNSIIMSSNEQCAMCEKRVYAMEKTEAGGKLYHKNCFRCSQCKCILRMDTFTSNKGTLFCTTHFKQLFKIKGNYDEGFGHETQYQVWQKKQSAAQPN